MEQSTKLADSNFEKLKRESERLEELTQTPCSWWIWIMIITVCIVFMWMIIFVRLLRALQTKKVPRTYKDYNII